jgi:hypothetical protein
MSAEGDTGPWASAGEGGGTGTPLAESTRRFLRPLVGIDPSTVRVHRDTAAEQMAAGRRADAVAAGDDIALGAGHAPGTPESPETLGLLAHELVHVARRRSPRFVPPIVRPRDAGQGAPPDGEVRPYAASGTAQSPGTVGPADPVGAAEEEAIARAVEARVSDVARAARARGLDALPSGDATGAAGATAAAPGMAAAEGAGPPARPAGGPASPEVSPESETSDPWGGLPAPWEPLPDWLVSPAPAPAPNGARNGSVAGAVAASAPAVAAAPPAVAPAAAVPVFAAEQGRTLEAQPPAEAGGAEAAGEGAAEPNLDALARKVHAILRRRLAAEHLRAG